LKVGVAGARVVEDPNGGVVLLGGLIFGAQSARIFKLQDALSAWVEMKQTLKIGRYFPVAFIVPDEITNCTQN
jgi:hypothetical protein